MRGYAARKRGDFQGAIAEYSRALALDPRHFKALFNRGFSHDKARRFLQAPRCWTSSPFEPTLNTA